MRLRDAQIIREMGVEYRRRAEAAENPDLRRQLAEIAAYCERMAAAIEALFAKQ
jgi:hypothetical protein